MLSLQKINKYVKKLFLIDNNIIDELEVMNMKMKNRIIDKRNSY